MGWRSLNPLRDLESAVNGCVTANGSWNNKTVSTNTSIKACSFGALFLIAREAHNSSILQNCLRPCSSNLALFLRCASLIASNAGKLR